MKKTSMIKASLLGCSSALGLNWIYDRKFLIEYMKDKDVLFQPIDHEAYKKARTSFDVYPDSIVGDLDFMGEVLYQFHSFLKDSENQDHLSWRNKFYDSFNSESNYKGYIEHYGEDLIHQIDKEKRLNTNPVIYTKHEDKQLVGPALLLAIYELDSFNNKAENATGYAKVLTEYSGVNKFITLLKNLFDDLRNGVEKIEALKQNTRFAPASYRESLKMAIEMKDQLKFIKEYSGVACGLNQSFPLIYNIVANSNTWEEALKMNAILGGASSARGLFLGAIFNIIDEVPEKYLNILTHAL